MIKNRVIDIARNELKYTENPPGSNQTKYGAEYGWNGVFWCVIFLWWCFKKAGQSAAFFGGAKTASCGTLYRWYREQGLIVPFEQVQLGDIVLENFSGTSDPEHCGLVEKIVDIESGWIRTIEGNTSPGLEGSQNNGGCVALKARNRKNIVAVLRPMYKEDEPKKDYEGHWAEEVIKWNIKNKIMEGYPDGNFKPQEAPTRAELAQTAYDLAEYILNQVKETSK